jgi:hypothetical protein
MIQKIYLNVISFIFLLIAKLIIKCLDFINSLNKQNNDQ